MVATWRLAVTTWVRGWASLATHAVSLEKKWDSPRGSWLHPDGWGW